MIIVKIMGGLGNQLQQYAVYRKFLELGIEAKVDVSWFGEREQEKQLRPRELELRYFTGLPYEVCTQEERVLLLGRDTSLLDKVLRRLLPGRCRYYNEAGRMYLPEIFSLQEAYLEGYWACEQYYADIMPKLREILIFPESGNPQNERTVTEMEGRQSVSVHIRRGDYLNEQNRALFGGICTAEYYEYAMDYIKKRVPEAHFYIFSDDPSYVKEKYNGPEYSVVDWNQGSGSFYDMYLMSHCRHNICANSTFSFWGARLNGHKDKIMIRPLKHRNNQVYDRCVMEKLWKGWILLDECCSDGGRFDRI